MEEKLFTADDLWKARKEGEDSKVLHNQPSELTKQFMEETKKQFEENAKQHEELRKAISELPTKKDLEILTLTLKEQFLVDLKQELSEFVTVSQFKPVQMIAYGIVTLVAGGAVTLLFSHMIGK